MLGIIVQIPVVAVRVGNQILFENDDASRPYEPCVVLTRVQLFCGPPAVGVLKALPELFMYGRLSFEINYAKRFGRNLDVKYRKLVACLECRKFRVDTDQVFLGNTAYKDCTKKIGKNIGVLYEDRLKDEIVAEGERGLIHNLLHSMPVFPL